MISDVHHVGIAVRSMEGACAFYRDALGLPLVKEGAAPGRGVRAAMLSVGRSYLEIVQPVADDSPFAKHIEERGEGLHHVGLWTDDVESQVTALREAGVPLQDREPRDGFTGRLSYLAAEAFDGVLLEVVQPEITKKQGKGNKAQDQIQASVTRIDHVVLRVPDASAICQHFQDYFGVQTKRTFERGPDDVRVPASGGRDPGGDRADLGWRTG